MTRPRIGHKFILDYLLEHNDHIVPYGELKNALVPEQIKDDSGITMNLRYLIKQKLIWKVLDQGYVSLEHGEPAIAKLLCEFLFSMTDLFPDHAKQYEEAGGIVMEFLSDMYTYKTEEEADQAVKLLNEAQAKYEQKEV